MRTEVRKYRYLTAVTKEESEQLLRASEALGLRPSTLIYGLLASGTNGFQNIELAVTPEVREWTKRKIRRDRLKAV